MKKLYVLLCAITLLLPVHTTKATDLLGDLLKKTKLSLFVDMINLTLIIVASAAVYHGYTTFQKKMKHLETDKRDDKKQIQNLQDRVCALETLVTQHLAR